MNRFESGPALLDPEAGPMNTVGEALSQLEILKRSLPRNPDRISPEYQSALMALRECNDKLLSQPIDPSSGLPESLEYVQGLIANLKTSEE